MDPAVWPGLWMVRRRRSPTVMHLVVGEHEVVGRQHRRVVGRDADVDAGVAHRLDRLDVVEVAVRGEHAAHAGGLAHLEQQLVLVGGVDDDRLTGARAADHEHVVLERPDDQLLDAHRGRLVVGGTRHGFRVPPTLSDSARTRPGGLARRDGRSGSVRATLPRHRPSSSTSRGPNRELRLLRRAGAAARRRASIPRGEVAVDRGAPPHGDHRGLRPRGVGADGERARPPEPPHPRGVRRPGLHLRRARHRARGDGPRAAVRALLLDRRARGRRHHQRRHRRPEGQAAARHRRR